VAAGIKIVEQFWVIETVGEQRLVTIDLAADRLGVGVQEELRRIAPLALAGLVGTVDPIAVALARLNPRNERVPDIAVDLDQLDAGLLPIVCDQAQLDLRRHL